MGTAKESQAFKSIIDSGPVKFRLVWHSSGSFVDSAFIHSIDLSCCSGDRMADLVANDPLVARHRDFDELGSGYPVDFPGSASFSN
jgi:hypothetical protein